MQKILSLVVTLVAYSDTTAGLWLRVQMVEPVSWIDAGLAAYIATMIHL